MLADIPTPPRVGSCSRTIAQLHSGEATTPRGQVGEPGAGRCQRGCGHLPRQAAGHRIRGRRDQRRGRCCRRSLGRHRRRSYPNAGSDIAATDTSISATSGAPDRRRLMSPSPARRKDVQAPSLSRTAWSSPIPRTSCTPSTRARRSTPRRSSESAPVIRRYWVRRAPARQRGATMQGDLVRRAQHGDADAFDVLAGDAYDRLFALAHRILRDGDSSDDAVQECLVMACRARMRACVRPASARAGW